MPSVDSSRDFSLELSPESTSKDSRKLFNPRLFSQTRTDVSVQFSRSRRRPAAGTRILAEPFSDVKRKRSGSFTFYCLFPDSQPKERTPQPAVRDRKHRPPSPLRQGYCTGTRAKNAQGLEASSGSGLDRVEGRVRATPLPRSNRARCAKGRSAKEQILNLLKSDAFRGGAPNRRNPNHRISEAAQR
jgi:hypothetical protein